MLISCVNTSHKLLGKYPLCRGTSVGGAWGETVWQVEHRVGCGPKLLAAAHRWWKLLLIFADYIR